MSAIAGIFHRTEQPVEPEQIQAMVDILNHRGPDREGVWIGASAGLGNRLLWTTCCSRAEHMPAEDADSGLVITADCRLDNREILWRLLEKQGPLGDDVADSALILQAYARWGATCPRYLLGDFAFAIWDKTQRRLFCARDPFGVKPFYYHCSGELFIFASEIKAILTDPRIGRELDEEWIGDYLTNMFASKTSTIYRSIRRLEPASTMVVTEDRVLPGNYWRLYPERRIQYDSEGEYFEEFRSLFFEAVRCRMRSIYPVGSMLSGGQDSSAITCVARALSTPGNPVHSFSAIFPSFPQCDESAYIQSVLAQNGLRAHCIDTSGIGSLQDYRKKLWHMDQPLTAYNGHIGWHILGHVADQGIRVVLDGSDGDSTVSYGDGFYRDLARDGKWNLLLRQMRNDRSVAGIALWQPFLRILWYHGLRPHVPEPGRAIGRTIRNWVSPSNASRPAKEGIGNWLDPEFIKRSGLRERRAAAAANSRWETAHEGHWKQLDSPMLPLLLEWLDHWGGAFSLEQRFPFCDRRLAEFCLAIPTNLKRSKGFDRYILRQALRDLVPREITERPKKADLTDVFTAVVKDHDKETWDNLLADSLKAAAGYINMNHAEQKCSRWRDGSLGRMEMRILWNLMFLGLWLKEQHSVSKRKGTIASLAII